jgi:hypothetical protein
VHAGPNLRLREETERRRSGILLRSCDARASAGREAVRSTLRGNGDEPVTGTGQLE